MCARVPVGQQFPFAVTAEAGTALAAVDMGLGNRQAEQGHVLGIDTALLFSVEPGFGGQSFLPHSPAQIAAVRAQISAAGRPVWLEVDGGINAHTAAEAARAGADAFVAGNAIFAAADPQKALADIRRAATI